MPLLQLFLVAGDGGLQGFVALFGLVDFLPQGSLLGGQVSDLLLLLFDAPLDAGPFPVAAVLQSLQLRLSQLRIGHQLPAGFLEAFDLLFQGAFLRPHLFQLGLRALRFLHRQVVLALRDHASAGHQRNRKDQAKHRRLVHSALHTSLA